jgi:pimeloyl-ACP methyl ester carboxylesterase
METQYLATPAGTLAYDLTGPAGAPLVLCTPGIGDVRRMYRFLAPPLVRAGYRVATLDIRGFGETDARWPSYAPADIGQDVLALIDHLGGPATLISNSYTGESAVWAAAQEPSKVTALVLTSPFLRTPPVGPLMRLALRLAIPVIGRFAGAWTAYYRSLYRGAKPADLAEYTAALRTNLREPGRLAAFRATFGHDNANAGARIAELRCPALVLMGEADPDFPDPAAEVAWLAGRLRDSGVEVRTDLVPGCGHYPPAEAPEHTAATVLPFLAAARGA